MSDFLGNDIKLDSNLDIIFTPEGDVETVSGLSCVAQDILIALSVSNIHDFLNDEESLESDLKSLLESILFNEPRVNPETITITLKKIQNGTQIDYICDLWFTPITEDIPANLTFTLSELITESRLKGE
jgi:hypothetical protein